MSVTSATCAYTCLTSAFELVTTDCEFDDGYGSILTHNLHRHTKHILKMYIHVCTHVHVYYTYKTHVENVHVYKVHMCIYMYTYMCMYVYNVFTLSNFVYTCSIVRLWSKLCN